MIKRPGRTQSSLLYHSTVANIIAASLPLASSTNTKHKHNFYGQIPHPGWWVWVSEYRIFNEYELAGDSIDSLSGLAVNSSERTLRPAQVCDIQHSRPILRQQHFVLYYQVQEKLLPFFMLQQQQQRNQQW